MTSRFVMIVCVGAACVPCTAMAAAAGTAPPVLVRQAVLEPVIARAGRATRIVVDVANPMPTPLRQLTASLLLPADAAVAWETPPEQAIAAIPAGAVRRLVWSVTAGSAAAGNARVKLQQTGAELLEHAFPVRWHPAVAASASDGVPAPEPVDTTPYLVGAFMCPLWSTEAWDKLGGRECWQPLFAYPERQPALGWYDEGTPEVTDWEIKWALDHGIRFFVPCWYRAAGNAGKPVEPVLEHWLEQGLLGSRCADQFRFAILWENGNPIASGVSSAEDLLEHLLPYWIEHYFRRPNYLTIAGKPLLFVYRMDILVEQLGGEAQTRAALEAMRRTCRDAGLGGLHIVGEHHTRMDEPLGLFTAVGADAVTSYHWPSFSGLMPPSRAAADIIAAQQSCWTALEHAAGVPAILTASVGWDPRPWYKRTEPGWQLPPDAFETLCRTAREHLEKAPPPEPGPRLVLLDNWNEFGEGHFLFPHREHGFDYLDAVRRVFGNAGEEHVDPVPEDMGRGPYDRAYRQRAREILHLQGWHAPAPGTMVRLDGDGLTVRCTNDDPHIACWEVPARTGNMVCSIRLRSETGTADGQLFWAVADRANARFSAAAAVRLELPRDTQWHTVTAALDVEGTLRGLRFDPGHAPGSVQIAWIRLARPDGTCLRHWSFTPGMNGPTP